jgi:hypothetical protein
VQNSPRGRLPNASGSPQGWRLSAPHDATFSLVPPRLVESDDSEMTISEPERWTHLRGSSSAKRSAEAARAFFSETSSEIVC